MTDVERNNDNVYGAIPKQNVDQSNKPWQEVNMQGIDDDKNINQYWDTQVRLGFIRKVYGILSVQLTFTFLMCLVSHLSQSFNMFQIANPGFLWISLIGTVVTMICIMCFRSLARNVPTNYILLGIFTLCESYMISFICGATNWRLVLMAAAMTSAIVISLTIYAYTTKTDFTVMGSMMFVIGCVMLLFGIFVMFTNNKLIHIIYSCMGVIAFSIYLVFDTQLIVGNHENKLEIDDFIVGALMLYTDIINLFLNILSLLKNSE